MKNEIPVDLLIKLQKANVLFDNGYSKDAADMASDVFVDVIDYWDKNKDNYETVFLFFEDISEIFSSYGPTYNRGQRIKKLLYLLQNNSDWIWILETPHQNKDLVDVVFLALKKSPYR